MSDPYYLYCCGSAVAIVGVVSFAEGYMFWQKNKLKKEQAKYASEITIAALKNGMNRNEIQAIVDSSIYASDKLTLEKRVEVTKTALRHGITDPDEIGEIVSVIEC